MTHVAILGAGPIGLEAGLAAAEAGLVFTIYEASGSVAGNVRSWGHVQLFTPWSMSVSARARRALASSGSKVPTGEECPTGAELVERVLEPLAALPFMAPRVRYGARVLEVGREGLLKSEEIGTGARGDRRFRILLRSLEGTESLEHADVVLDCTGSYHNPNALGSGGIHAPGEAAAAEHIIRQIPDLDQPESGDEAPGWAGARILLVGSGHSAQTAARDLADLVKQAPATEVIWAIRAPNPTFGVVADDPLPLRAELVRRARTLARQPESPLDVRPGRAVRELSPSPGGIRVVLESPGGDCEEVVVDRIVSLTGAVGDARIYRQLQVHECYATSGPMKLAAALLASSSADCLTQESHGAQTLESPEPDFYILGMKSYGRSPSFLMRVGWEQVDEVFSLLEATAVAADGAA